MQQDLSSGKVAGLLVKGREKDTKRPISLFGEITGRC